MKWVDSISPALERILSLPSGAFRAACEEGLTRLIRGGVGGIVSGIVSGIDVGVRLSGGVNFRQLREIRLIQALAVQASIHGIAVEGNHKIHIARWIG